MVSPDKPFASGWRDMAYVPRWAILRRNRHQFLAEHSYFTAVYADQVARFIGWKGDYAKLLRYALYHDLEETVTGDIPGPAKRAAWDAEKAKDHVHPVLRAKFGVDVADALREKDPEICAIVSFADSVEEVAYLLEESLSGNSRWIKPVLDEAKARMIDKWWDLPVDPVTLMEKEWLVMNMEIFQNMVPELLEDKRGNNV